MKLEPKVEKMLANYPKLKTWIEASGVSGELYSLPDSTSPTKTLLLYISDEEAQKTTIVREGEGSTRHASPVLQTIKELRGLVGTIRSFQIHKAAENVIEVQLPMNAVQLHNMLAHVDIKAIGSLHKVRTQER